MGARTFVHSQSQLLELPISKVSKQPDSSSTRKVLRYGGACYDGGMNLEGKPRKEKQLKLLKKLPKKGPKLSEEPVSTIKEKDPNQLDLPMDLRESDLLERRFSREARSPFRGLGGPRDPNDLDSDTDSSD